MDRSDADEIRKISYNEFHAATLELAKKLDSKKIVALVPVPRGGYIPATILSYYLNKPIFHYSDIILTKQKGYLIVDEVCDTGITFAALRAKFPNALMAAVYIKPMGLSLCDYYSIHVSQLCWLEFPWGE